MRAEYPARPVPDSNVIRLDVAARRGAPVRAKRLSWRTCLSAWIGLSAASWAAVIAVAVQVV